MEPANFPGTSALPVIVCVEFVTDELGGMADVNRDRHLERLGLGPEGVVVGIPVADAVGRVRKEVDALHPEPRRPPDLRHALLDVDERYLGNGDQPIRVPPAKVGEPVVVDPAVGGGEFRVAALRLPAYPHGGIEHADVDAALVHPLDALVGILGGGEARVLVLDASGLEPDRFPLLEGGADPGVPAEASAVHDFRLAPVDFHVFEPFLVLADAQCAVAVPGLDVLFPEVRRLHDVAVGIDDFSTHRSMLLACFNAWVNAFSPVADPAAYRSAPAFEPAGRTNPAPRTLPRGGALMVAPGSARTVSG